MVVGKISLTLTILMILGGCTSYKSSFACGDSKGAACTPIDAVDRMIASGEIERFTGISDRCTKGKCNRSKTVKGDELPELKSDRLQKDNIYFKEPNKQGK